MKYFPVFKRKIVIERNDVTTDEIANMMAKVDGIRVMSIDGDSVQCRKINKPEMGYYSFNPDFKITLVKNGETSELHCLFYLKKPVQILIYIYSFIVLVIQIVALIVAQGEIIFPCFIPPIFIIYSLLLSSLCLRYQVRKITDDIRGDP